MPVEPMNPPSETCPRCQGWVWHRVKECNCKATVVVEPKDEPDYLEMVGQRITATRCARKWSLSKLADKIGMSKSGLWAVEKGQSEPMARTLVALANALDVTTDYLLLR